ncbi:hypothetical protein [Cupriavidus plantarum]|uniref:hypothetical protein n=1 Tax=Cupriavidus plantarum TaxID=942865 RepID=UPI00339D5963
MNAEVLFQKALSLVHQHRAASAALLQRHLGVDASTAEPLLERMVRETTAMRRMPNGLYLYIHGAISEELAALHGFAQIVLDAIAEDRVDAGQLRDAAVRFGLAKTPTGG